MREAHAFLEALTIVLCAAGATAVVFQRLRQPVVLGYILAGVLVGPYFPFPLFADREIVQSVSELGVIMLMFSLGLEFTLGKLVRVGPTAIVTAVVQSSLMIWLGYLVGSAFGWTSLESLFAGAIIAISSTTIIAKAFAEQRIAGPFRDLVVGVLIVEDLIAVVLMAVLTALATSGELSIETVAWSSGQLLLFLGALIVIGMAVIPRLVRGVARLGRPETTLVTSVGICFAVTLMTQLAGYSVALGAFLAGSLVAESGHEKSIEKLIEPVRDIFAAVFFVSVGMLIDPHLVAEHWLAALILTVVVVVGKIAGVSVGAFLTGNGVRTSVRAGMSLAQIGEFSFIIALLGSSVGVGGFLYPVAVAVSAATALTTPWLIRSSDRFAEVVERSLPASAQTFAAVYSNWFARLRAPATGTRARTRFAAMARKLAVDAALLAAIVVATSVFTGEVAAWLASSLRLPYIAAAVAVTIAAAALAVPFGLGIVRVARELGTALADAARPAGAESDVRAGPRRALVAALQLLVILAVVAPLLALSRPFLPGVPAIVVMLVLLLLMFAALWKSATDLHGHVRTGAEIVANALVARRTAMTSDPSSFDELRPLLSSLGDAVPVVLDESSPSVGKTLRDLDLRAATGATVLAVSRAGAGVVLPSSAETLQAGDVLALGGAPAAVEAAARLLGTR